MRVGMAAWALDDVNTVFPGALSSCLGTAQWFAILRFRFVSVFKRAYSFELPEPQDFQAQLPQRFRKEFAVFAALAALLAATIT